MTSNSKDLFHNVVKSAFIKDAWKNTDYLLFLKVGGVNFCIYIDAEKLIAAERNDKKLSHNLLVL